MMIDEGMKELVGIREERKFVYSQNNPSKSKTTKFKFREKGVSK